MLGLRRRGLDTGSGLSRPTLVLSGVSTAGEELNKTEDRSLDVESTGVGCRLGVSRFDVSSLCDFCLRLYDTSSVELVGDCGRGGRSEMSKPRAWPAFGRSKGSAEMNPLSRFDEG